MSGLALCYNRGCLKEFDLRNNPPDSDQCKHHPGYPLFHETYKKWTCCNKKSTDFTDFLNTPGCKTGPHSREKPVEPEVVTGNLDSRSLEQQLTDLKKEKSPEPLQRLPRPDFNTTTLTRIEAVPTTAFKKTLESQTNTGAVHPNTNGVKAVSNDDAIGQGEPCKHGGCKAKYQEASADGACVYHPGVPIFHEGMKFWSCCQKKTSDFQAFLDQEGCNSGEHQWKKESAGSATVKCKYDWHQTATYVTIAIYAKKYDHKTVSLDVNPIRMKFHVYFPQEAGAFDLDLELKGVVEVKDCSCSISGTKIEIKLKKAEPGLWAKLDNPRPANVNIEKVIEEPKIEDQVDALDLDDLDFSVQRPILSTEASMGRTDAQII